MVPIAADIRTWKWPFPSDETPAIAESEPQAA